MVRNILLVLLLVASVKGMGQTEPVTGTVKDRHTRAVLGFCNVHVVGTAVGTHTDEKGIFKLQVPASGLVGGQLIVSFLGYEPDTIALRANQTHYSIFLKPSGGALNEVVVTGTPKEMSRLESPVPVEVYNPAFFREHHAQFV